MPESIHDGDEGTARWLVYKYSGKKNKLWETLEKKYGVAVPQAHEWPDEPVGGEEEPEVITFDDEEEKPAEAKADTTGDSTKEGEPDL